MRNLEMIKSVMLDLETFGTRAGCAIRSIGAVVFDPYSDEIGDRFYQNVTSESCRKSKLHFDPDTMNWWKQQSSEVQQVFDVNPVHLKMAIMTFNDWFRSSSAEFVWSHGAAFDPPVYEATCHAVGFKAPWNYRGVRDTRTLFELAGLKTEDLPFTGMKHNALDDAIHQAKCVQEAMKRLRIERESLRDERDACCVAYDELARRTPGHFLFAGANEPNIDVKVKFLKKKSEWSIDG
jgi:hypothetical protein